MTTYLFLAVTGIAHAADRGALKAEKGIYPAADSCPVVLVIHSYYPTLTWSEHITAGIRDYFSRSDFRHAKLYFEYMDAKRHPEPQYLDLYAELLQLKYRDPDAVDVIVCSDDQALNFFLDRSDTLFPGIPLVFCGVNGYRPGMRHMGRPLTGVIEAIEPGPTLEVALELQPDTRQVLVINDTTRTGRAIEQTARAAFAPFRKRLKFQYVSDLSLSELQRKVSTLPEGAIVFLFVFNRDNEGRDFSHEESLHLIARHCAVPIYGPWSFYLGHGIVGGMLTSGEIQGKTAAQLAIRILQGERAGVIPVVTKSPNQYLFDYHQMTRHHLALQRLPPGSRVINRPAGLYQKYRYRIWVGAGVLIVQGAVIFLLLVNMRRRRLAEKRLSASIRRYRSLVETLADIVFNIDEKGMLTYLNPQFEKITGYPVRAFLGRPFTEILAPEAVQSTVDRFSRELAGQEFPVYEVDVMSRTGIYVPIELKVTALRDEDGHAVGWIGVARDVHERREAEKEKRRLEGQLRRAQKMEAIGTLAGGVAHDLNNILSGIVSYPDLMLMDLPDDSPLIGPIKTIRETGERCAPIVQDLLTLARRGVAAMDSMDSVNLNKIISEYLRSPEHDYLTTLHREVKFDIRLEKNLLNILGSPVHLSKTVMNLLINGAEAMPEGGHIIVSTENRYLDEPISGYDQVEEGDYVVLTVSDTGVGMSHEDKERIFEPFYTKKAMGRSGTGLGMAVVWGTVKDHRGYIDMDSVEGRGTTFSLYFPVTRKEAKADEKTVSMDSYRGKGETILVVDDMESQREIASLILSRLAYTVATVSSGEEAVDYLRNHQVDLVVLDMIMAPGMDGLDTYRRILERHPGQKAIIASGFSETDRVRAAQKLGAGQYVKKPYSSENIGMAVRKELDR